MHRLLVPSGRSPPEPPDHAGGPQTARDDGIDAVRGFALFGVLLVNMYSFGADSIAWNDPANRLCFMLKHALFESKSWTLFSLLFGFSFATQLSRWPPALARPRMLRRLFILLAFGSVHALLYDGDILRLYAELGLLLLVVVELPTRWLLAAAGCLLAVFPLTHALGPDRAADDLHAVASVAEADDVLLEEQAASIYATGSLGEILQYNAEDLLEIPWADTAWPDSGLAVLALLLLGVCLARSGVFRNPAAQRPLLRRICGWCLGAGLVAVVAEAALGWIAGYDVYRVNRASVPLTFTGDLLFTSGTLLVATGEAAAVLLLADTRRGRRWLAPLAAAGRMGLSVYLTQTLAFTTLFYGYGLGQAYRLGPLAVTAAAVGIYAGQLLVCSWWLRRFRYGPAEWLWRTGTAGIRSTTAAAKPECCS